MSGTLNERLISEVAEQSGLTIVDRQELPGREPTLCPVPTTLDSAVRELIESRYPNGLYSHQAYGIQASLEGQDVCLATSTASGKSLVFMAAAAHALQHSQTAKVLALYPARALIQDQIKKWQEILEPLGLTSGYIDGGVPPEHRLEILNSSHVMLMTPDVAHAWLMSHLGEKHILTFLRNLNLLILDEAHVYEGVFGTNMAYFLRRLQIAARSHRLICSTATLGKPDDFMYRLTGREPQVFAIEQDGSPSPEKTVLLAKASIVRTGKLFESLKELLVTLGRVNRGRFLAFADSRKMVERLVAAAQRREPIDAIDAEPSEVDGLTGVSIGQQPVSPMEDAHGILPYRAGYETEDRNAIQRALAHGELSGVVSTSALELGLDIGEIDLVILLTLPPTMKAFWQRVGRGGRRQPGVCLVVDDRGPLSESSGKLGTFLQKALEPSWLYLENRYIQYANALCAAQEFSQLGESDARKPPFQSLPPTFCEYLENELNPTESVPTDLYPLKQKALAGPHREFPVRSGIEQEFCVKGPHNVPLGNLMFPQALREAYPGAIYHYMARPYRVYRFDYRKGEILVKREKHWTTQPLAQTMVFPRFQGGMLSLFKSEMGFLAETEMQVSERVLGFVEQRGSTKEEHRYGPKSPHYQRALNRFFETTGVCWYFTDRSTLSEAIAWQILSAFCIVFGVQTRDLGVGMFHSKNPPLGIEKCQGVCIFDAAYGSLRLTQRLGERFLDVLDAAIEIGQMREGAEEWVKELVGLARLARELRPVSVGERSSVLSEDHDSDWVEVIAPSQTAMYMSPDGPKRVKVLGYRYTPQGLKYDLEHPKPETKWTVSASAVQPIYGETAMVRANLISGDTEALN